MIILQTLTLSNPSLSRTSGGRWRGWLLALWGSPDAAVDDGCGEGDGDGGDDEVLEVDLFPLPAALPPFLPEPEPDEDKRLDFLACSRKSLQTISVSLSIVDAFNLCCSKNGIATECSSFQALFLFW